MKVSVIIVNYNTAGYLKSCIDSVNKFEREIEKEFVIVDNNSEDNSKDIINGLVSLDNNVKSVLLESNHGFAYANNKGVEVCSGDYILILNPDVQFTESIFELLINLAGDSGIGALGAKLYGEKGDFQYRYYQKHPSLMQYLLFYSVLSKPFIGRVKFENLFLNPGISKTEKTLQSVPQIPGAFIFLRKEIYSEFKGFNESFFLFFEDVDLSFRISEKYKLCLADIKVVHTGASSMMSDNYKIYGYYVLSMLNFYRNNYSYVMYLVLKSVIMINTLLKITVESFKKLFGIDKPGIMKVHKYILSNL